MRRCLALSPSSGHHGCHGPSAVRSVEEGFTLAPGTVRMEIAVRVVHWYVYLKYTHSYTDMRASCLPMIIVAFSQKCMCDFREHLIGHSDTVFGLDCMGLTNQNYLWVLIKAH